MSSYLSPEHSTLTRAALRLYGTKRPSNWTPLGGTAEIT
jgi:hypothetical protein